MMLPTNTLLCEKGSAGSFYTGIYVLAAPLVARIVDNRSFLGLSQSAARL